MTTLDLATNGPELRQAYESVRNASQPGSWALFTYGPSNDLRVQAQGSDGVDEMKDELSDSKVQYGFIRMLDPVSNLPKFVYLAWCGEGAPGHRKGFFTSHMNQVAKLLEITARDLDDISPEIINQKIEAAGGSKYGGSSGSVSAPKPAPSPATSTKPAPAQSPVPSGGPGNPEQPVQAPQAPSASNDEDEWGGTPEVRSRSPVRVESAYKPVNISDNIRAAPPKSAEPTTSSETPAAFTAAKPSNSSTSGRSELEALRAKGTGNVLSRFQEKKDDVPAAPGARQAKPTGAPKKTFGTPGTSADRAAGTRPVFPGTQSRPESKAISGMGSKALEGGKSPQQLWAERKARAAGASTEAPAAPAASSRPSEPVREPEDHESKESTGGVSAMREKFANQNLESAGRPMPADRQPSSAPSPPPAPGAPGGESEQEAAEELEPDEPEPESEPAAAAPSIPVAPRAMPKAPESDNEADNDGWSDDGGKAAQSEPEDEQDTTQARVPPPAPMATRPSQASNMPPIPTAPRASHEAEEQQQDEQYQEDEQEDIRDVQKEQIPDEPESAHEEPGQQAQQGEGESLPNATVLYDYEAQEGNEMDLHEGETIVNVRQLDEGWWSGTSHDGQRSGMFPSNYVESQDADSDQIKAEALYDYEAQEENEISFQEGAILTQIKKLDENWWEATSQDGDTGMFPSNYVRVL